MTEQKVRKHLHRIWFHWARLQKALNDAHNAEIIVYGSYTDEGPCFSLYQLKDRLEATTKDAIAKTLHRSLRNEVDP
jgi:hypothetical protein